MADFSFLSDSDDEKAVQLILSQASDSIALEQIAAINCSGFSDSVLPSHIESRFNKLKSFPSVSSKPNPVIRSHSVVSSDFKESAKKERVASKCDKSLDFSGKDEIFSSSEKNPNGGNSLKGNSEPDFSLDDEYFWDSMKLKNKKSNKLKSLTETSSSESLSPPKRNGCFWCSPKRVSKKNNRNQRSLDVSSQFRKDVKGNDRLADLNNYLEKKQQKLMKIAMAEELKISREAEKIVKLAKQASARIEVSSIEDELSDRSQ